MSKGLIFITGATGFIGSEVLSVSLKAGYNVRLAVRKESQIRDLKKLFPADNSLMDFVVVPDLTKPGAFEGKLDGTDYVFHLASPMPGKGEDFKKEYLEPAVKGTGSILEAALAFPSIKRVTIMASILSIMPMGGLAVPNLFVKENSNDLIEVDVDMQFPSGFDGYGAKYQASKILAHQFSNQFIHERKPHFDIITLHPSFVLGHSLVQKSADEVTGVVMMFMNSLRMDKPMFPSTIVDLRDVAEATLATIDAKIERNGEEFIISGEKTTWDDVVSFVKEKYPQVPLKLTPPFDQPFEANSSKAQRLLGSKWRGMGEIVSSVLDQQLGFQKDNA